MPTLPTLSDSVANSLGLSKVKAVQTVGKSVGSKTLRREWRIIANTGELRGVCWRERNPKRKAVRYVGKRNKPNEFKPYASVFEGWRRANRTFAGADFKSVDDTVGKGSSAGSVGNG